MRLLICCCFLFCLSRAVPGQNGAAAVEQRPISKQQWEKASRDLDYSSDVQKEAPKEEVAEPEDASKGPQKKVFQGLGVRLLATIFQVLAILIAVAAIGYAVYRMLLEPRNKSIARDGTEITAENLENYLPETDLERFLREALAAGNFTLAVRIHYLQLIKNLSEAGTIQWSMEKTNRDYLREMREHPQVETFQDLTYTYERIWYGNAGLDAEAYAGLAGRFLAFHV